MEIRRTDTVYQRTEDVQQFGQCAPKRWLLEKKIRTQTVTQFMRETETETESHTLAGIKATWGTLPSARRMSRVGIV